MVKILTHDIDNTHGIDLDSWYRIGTTESRTYERAECYPYAGFLDLEIESCKNMNKISAGPSKKAWCSLATR